MQARVESHADAVAALRYCDWLCTALSVQSHSVHNTNFLKVALLQYTFTQLLPMPAPASDAARAKSCVWRVPLLYDEQLSILVLLQRIAEHFASSVLPLNLTRSLDGVRMVVPACAAAVADCVMRQLATNIPSELCAHLSGVSTRGGAAHRGFCLDAGPLAAQAAVIVCHSAELNTARLSALDYFTALTQASPIFRWDKGRSLTKPLARWLRHVCAERAFPSDEGSLIKYVCDVDALMIKNYPEMRCYRDVAFFFKYFLNPDRRCFPDGDSASGLSQRAISLRFSFDHGQFQIKTLGGHSLQAEPARKRNEPPPTHRFTSLALAGEYTSPSSAETEDDILHIWEVSRCETRTPE